MKERPNVLFLVHRVPYPPNRGDRIRSFHMLKHLASRANVSLATLADEPVQPETVAELDRHCRRVAIEPLGRGRWLGAVSSLAAGKSATEGLFRSAALRRTVETWASEVRFDAVVVFCSSMAQYLTIPALSGAATLFDLVDVDSQKFFDYAKSKSAWKSVLYRLEGRRLRSLESTISRSVDAVTLVSEAEAKLFRDVCPNDNTFAVPNGVDLQYFQPQQDTGTQNRCVFVGVLDYPPNIDAMQWFCRKVFPMLREQLPNATLAIVGRNPTSAVRQLADVPGVEVIASVPDVRPYMAQASVAIAPLRIARGIQNKVLEAMAMALPVVVSPAALEGLTVEPGRDVLCAESADQWVHDITRLCRDRAMAIELGRAGRSFVESTHSWSACLSKLDEVLHLHAGNSQNTVLAASGT